MYHIQLLLYLDMAICRETIMTFGFVIRLDQRSFLGSKYMLDLLYQNVVMISLQMAMSRNNDN